MQHLDLKSGEISQMWFLQQKVCRSIFTAGVSQQFCTAGVTKSAYRLYVILGSWVIMSIINVIKQSDGALRRNAFCL